MQYSSDISLWWLIPLACIAFALAFWLYNKKSNSWIDHLSRKARLFLVVLRSISIFCIGLLLFGIIFQSFNYRVEKPILLLGIDNSSSMLNYSDSNNVPQTIQKLRTTFNDELSEKFELISYSFSGLPETLEDSILFNKESTDLALSLETVKNEFYNRNLAGIVMVSDGNYNTGFNPLYQAERFKTSSIYVLGVGDTITKRDQFIKHISYNDVAFYKNDFPIVVDVQGIKMEAIQTTVSIEHDGKLLQTEKITYPKSGDTFQQLTFFATASKPGIQKYTIRLRAEKNEYNYENNTQDIYINVIDNRSKVLILSSAPHPDITALKSVWEKDPNLEVQFSLLSEWDKNLKNVDLIVWHEAGQLQNSALIDVIMNNSIAKFFIVGSQSKTQSIQNLQLGIQIPSGTGLDDVFTGLNANFNLFQLSDDVYTRFENFPPLKTRYGRYQIPRNAQVLSYQRVGSVVKNDAQLFFSKYNQKASYKYAFLVGEGLWRWKLVEFAKFGDNVAFDEVFSKTAQYLMLKTQTEPLRIILPKKFTTEAAISLEAIVLNPSLKPITTEDVYFEIKSEGQKITKLKFAKSNKKYNLELGLLPAGKYKWKASASISGKIHVQKGEFVVQPSYIEQQKSKANFHLMKKMAQNTKGKFSNLENFATIIEALKERNDFTSIKYRDTSFNELIHYFYLFILLITTLFIEWFLRRYWGSY